MARNVAPLTIDGGRKWANRTAVLRGTYGRISAPQLLGFARDLKPVFTATCSESERVVVLLSFLRAKLLSAGGGELGKFAEKFGVGRGEIKAGLSLLVFFQLG